MVAVLLSVAAPPCGWVPCDATGGGLPPFVVCCGLPAPPAEALFAVLPPLPLAAPFDWALPPVAVPEPVPPLPASFRVPFGGGAAPLLPVAAEPEPC